MNRLLREPRAPEKESNMFKCPTHPDAEVRLLTQPGPCDDGVLPRRQCMACGYRWFGEPASVEKFVPISIPRESLHDEEEAWGKAGSGG